jgi:outer membrane protein insertion porin family
MILPMTTHNLNLSRYLSLSLVLFSFLSAAHGQSFLPKRIIFTGAPDFKQDELLAASGLKANTAVSQKEIQAAAQKLNDTGAFSDIRYAFDSTGLTFRLTPATDLLPVRYNNFVWWQSEELDKVLRQRVPLFRGKTTAYGYLADIISAALTALLAEKGITATVMATPYEPRRGAPIESIGFSVTSPPILIHSLAIEGTSAEMMQHLQPVIHNFSGLDFDTHGTPTSIGSEIAAVYSNYGYLDVDVTSIREGEPKLADGHLDLDVVASIKEGELYHLTHIDWPGSDIYSAADFTKNAKLKPGDIAAQSALRATLQPLRKSYAGKGYMEAKIKAVPEMDHTAHTVSYSVSVEPGAQYRVQAIKTLNLTDVQQKEFDSAWRLKPGEIYDENYVTSFLTKNTALRSLEGYSGSFKTVGNPDTHLAVVTITFVKGGVINRVVVR